MAELYLVRHGQASFGADNYDQLSLLGQQQGRLLGEYFAERNIVFDHVLVGTMNRHRQTAEAIFQGSTEEVARLKEHRGLNEYDFVALIDGLGDEHRELQLLAKKSKKDFYRALRQVLLLWMEDRIEGPIPETWSQFQQRVADAKSYIQGLEGRILAVTSGGVVAAMAQQTLGAPREKVVALNLQINNCSFCRYFFNADSFHLATFNSIPYFDQADRLDFITYG